MPKLYVIGLGPGDPELITVKAAKILRMAPIVFVPYSTGTNRSLAYSVIARYVSGSARIVFLGFPMVTDPSMDVLLRNSEVLCNELSNHEYGVYAVLGDPALYSTFYKLLNLLLTACQGISIEVIPGVTAMTACTARALKPLTMGDDALALIPSTRTDILRSIVGLFEAVVLYKGNKITKSVLDLLRNNNYELTYARRCFMNNEVISNDVSDIGDDYFSTVIATKRKYF